MDPAPVVHPLQDHTYRCRLQADACLLLVVERPVETRHIEVDLHSAVPCSATSTPSSVSPDSSHSGLPTGRSVAASLLPFQRRQRHAHHQVVARRFVAEGTPAVVLAVDANAVEQIAVVRRSVDERLAGKEVLGDCWEIPGGEFVQLGGVVAVFMAVDGEGEGYEKVARFARSVRSLHSACFRQRGRQQCDESVGELPSGRRRQARRLFLNRARVAFANSTSFQLMPLMLSLEFCPISNLRSPIDADSRIAAGHTGHTTGCHGAHGPFPIDQLSIAFHSPAVGSEVFIEPVASQDVKHAWTAAAD